MVEPAIEGGGLEHGVFAADLVGKGRYLERVFHAAHHVQVGHAGFDHHHVRTFSDIQRDLTQRFIGIAGVHLVFLLVAFAQIGRRTDGVTEWPVKGTGVFGAVGHDPGVHKMIGFERLADGANAAVHHVAGRHDIHTRTGLCECLLYQDFNGGVVQDIAVLCRPGVGQTVLAMAGEGVQRHVGHDTQAGKFPFQRLHHTGHQPLGV